MVATIIHGNEGEVAKPRKWTNLRPFRGNNPVGPFRPWFNHGDEEELPPEELANVISQSDRAKISKYICHDMALSDKDDAVQVDRLC